MRAWMQRKGLSQLLLWSLLGGASCMTSGQFSGDGRELSNNADGSQSNDTSSTGTGDTASSNAGLSGSTPVTTTPVNPNGGATAATPTADSNLIVDANYPWALVGRFDLSNASAPRFSLPNTKIGIRFTGTSLGVYFADSGYDTFSVTIDGVAYAATSNQFSTTPGTTAPCLPFAQVPAANGKDWPGCLLLVKSANAATPTLYPVASDLPAGEHVAWLTKRTEFYQGNCGTTQFFGVKLDDGATLLPAPGYKKRRIEVIGDSSTSGYGSAQRTPCGFTERNMDSDIAFAGQLGNFLHAEVVNISSSGQGVYRSMYDHNILHNLPILYRSRLPLEIQTPYDFSQDHVDVIVLSAGGDDLWGNSGSGAFNNGDGKADQSTARANFVAAYTDWLSEIRSKRPDAYIVCMLSYAAFGGDVTLLGGAIQEVVTNRNNAGDNNVAYFWFYPPNDAGVNPKRAPDWGTVRKNEGFVDGCAGHPSPPEAQYLVKAVGPGIAAKMGWTDIGFGP